MNKPHLEQAEAAVTGAPRPLTNPRPEISHGFVWNRATRRALRFRHDLVNGVNRLRQH